MKIALTLDDKLIAQAMVALDATTHADAIKLALQRVVRKHDYQRILALRGALDRGADKAGSLDDLVGVLSPAMATVTTEELCAPVGEKKAKK